MTEITTITTQDLPTLLAESCSAIRPRLRRTFQNLNPADIDDVLQDTAIRVLECGNRRAITWPDRRALVAFLHRTAQNLAINLLQKQKKQPVLSIDDGAGDELPAESAGGVDPATELADREQARELLRRIEALPPSERDVLLLDFEGVGSAEIPELLDRTRNSTYLGRKRGIERLNSRLTPQQATLGHFGGGGGTGQIGYLRLGGVSVEGRMAPRPVPLVDERATVRLRAKIDDVNPPAVMVGIPLVQHDSRWLDCAPCAVELERGDGGALFTLTTTLALLDGSPAPAGAGLVQLELGELAE